MVEAVLVLPFIMFVVSLVVFFGLSMQEFQRTAMVDRYESWRGSSRAPGPATGISELSSTLQLRETFFRGKDMTLSVEPTDYFPVEAHDDWQIAASNFDDDAGRLVDEYFANFPRGRSMRFFADSNHTVALWERWFPGAIRHRHTVMDTQWRYVNKVIESENNEWYNDDTGQYDQIRPVTTEDIQTPPPTLMPSESVRETFFADFDRRLDLLGPGNTLAQRLQEFYQASPNYWGPSVEPRFENGVPWR